MLMLRAMLQPARRKRQGRLNLVFRDLRQVLDREPTVAHNLDRVDSAYLQ